MAQAHYHSYSLILTGSSSSSSYSSSCYGQSWSCSSLEVARPQLQLLLRLAGRLPSASITFTRDLEQHLTGSLENRR